MTSSSPVLLTLQDTLEHSVEQFSSRPALAFVGEKPMTYSELGDAVHRVGGELYRLGVVPGDRIALLGHNSPFWGVAYFAIVSYGAVVIPILPDFSPAEMANILLHAEPVGIFVSDRLFPKISELTLPSKSFSYRLDDLSLTEGSMLPEASLPARIPYRVKEEDLASIIYTSGTTGRSKGVMLTHRNIVWVAQQSRTFQDVVPEDVFLSILPLSHTLENTIAFVYPIRQGASIYYIEKHPTPNVLTGALEKVRPTFVLSVPLVMEKVYKARVLPELTRNKILKAAYAFPFTRKLLHRVAARKLYRAFGGRIKFFGIGGSKLDLEVERFLLEGKFPYAIGYGLTETAPLLAGAAVNKTRLQSTGSVVPGLDLKIVNPDPETGIGEIVVKGPNVMTGYYKEPELTREAFTEDGYFRTGDLGLLNSEGYLYIKGRLKNMILSSSGENIYPEDIETLINAENFVLESLVVEKKGRLVALVHLNYEELEKHIEQFRKEASHMTAETLAAFKEKYGERWEQWNEKYSQQVDKVSHLYVEKWEQLNEIYSVFLEHMKKKVNAKLSRSSQISRVEAVSDPFEKTATQKIKRYLYSSSTGNKKEKK